MPLSTEALASGFARRPRSRQSVGYLPSPNEEDESFGKENVGDMTTSLDLRPLTVEPLVLNKRSRSRSLGPGGLDALKEDAGNRRKAATIATPRSILKPSISLSPLKDIPRRKSNGGTKQPKSPFKSPRKVAVSPQNHPRMSGTLAVVDRKISPLKPGNDSFTKALEISYEQRNEEILKSKTIEDEVIHARTDALKQRDMRRKSMVNRRVSFAPEATLHTWDMIEEMQDSTTSSASTNVTRRASAVTDVASMLSPTNQQSPHTSSLAMDDAPSTLLDHPEDEYVPESPASQHYLLPKSRHRRTSAVPPMNFNNPDDVFSSPCSNAPGSDDEETFIKKGDLNSVIHPQNLPCVSPAKSTNDEGRTQDTESSSDELGDSPTKSPNNGRTPRSQSWDQKLLHGIPPVIKFKSLQMQDNTNPFSPAFKSAIKSGLTRSPKLSCQDDGELSMEMTCAVGAIVPISRSQSPSGLASEDSIDPEQSVRSRRRSSIGSSYVGEMSMDLTTAIGGIRANEVELVNMSNLDTNEELSMEFTSVFGGIQNRNFLQAALNTQAHSPAGYIITKEGVNSMNPRNDQSASIVGEEMRLTKTFGDIFQMPTQASTSDQEESDTDMEVTRAIGSIVFSRANPAYNDRRVAEKMNDDVVTIKSPLRSHLADTAKSSTLASPSRNVNMTEEQGRAQSSRGFPSHIVTPNKQSSTVLNPTTPNTTQITTATGTPPLDDVTGTSPDPRCQDNLGQGHTKFISTVHSNVQSQANRHHAQIFTGPTANIRRRVSGAIFDKEGPGPPNVAVLLNRRLSITEETPFFPPMVSGPQTLHFGDSKILSAQVASQRGEDEFLETRRYVLEQEANSEGQGRDATITLKEAIVSMTPKRKRLDGRKSLAVGAAKGLLGVRPAELDNSDEDGNAKSKKSAVASPPKKIKLSASSTASQVVDRLNEHRQSLAGIPVNITPTLHSIISPSKTNVTITPISQISSRSNDHGAIPNVHLPLPTSSEPRTDIFTAKEIEEAAEKIHLRDFLNLTNIRFIELNTTKRRHTAAPQTDQDTLARKFNDEDKMMDMRKKHEESAIAGACTVPLLELYQHSCRELKKYIGEGRDVINEIEIETYDDNPALFRKYISASLADRAVLDQQFKNLKTHARLLSKGMWYEWRMKLLEGLKEGLLGNATGLQSDANVLMRQESLLGAVLPEALEKCNALGRDCAMLRARADELATLDEEELRKAQEQLVSMEHECSAKTQLIEDYEHGFDDLDFAIKHAQRTRLKCLQSIREAQKIHEENRGWSSVDVSNLHIIVDGLESKYGWAITSAASGTLTLVYRRQLQIYFDIEAFLPTVALSSSKVENAPIGLVYIGDIDQKRPEPLTTEKRFFLQLMRAQVQCLPQHQTRVKDLLRFVQEGWDKALRVCKEVFKLDIEFVTDCKILNDEHLTIQTTLLLSNLQTKVQITFGVGAAGKAEEVEMGLTVKACVIYGENYKEGRMGEFLMSKIKPGSAENPCSWVDAVRDLKKRLITQGKKH